MTQCPAATRGGAIQVTSVDEQRRSREAELVRRAQAGDRIAFEQLYRDNLGRVYALCFRMAGTAELAEELAQDVFVRAWQKLGSFRGESAFSSWLHPLTVNVALSERRSRRRRVARVMTTDDLTAFERPGPSTRSEGPAPSRPEAAAGGVDAMTCEEARDRMDDYVDGALDEAAFQDMELHVAICAECRSEERSLRALLAHAAALPSEQRPSRDLWAGIAERLDEAP